MSNRYVEDIPRLNRYALLTAILFSAIHFATFFDIDRAIVTDIRYFLYFAWQITEGAIPHLDLFDNKNFLSSFVGALFYMIGTWLDIDQLSAIRLGFLGICTIGGVLFFTIFYRLSNGSLICAFLGLFAYLGFGLIGDLSAIGNVPKQLMCVLALSMALFVQQRLWFLAGLAGALAFMDWQIGVIVWMSAFISSLFVAGNRIRNRLFVILGGVAGLIPFVLFFAYHGALKSWFEQTIVVALFRTTHSTKNGSSDLMWSHIWNLIQKNICPINVWLFIVGLIGFIVAIGWLCTLRRTAKWELLFPLSLYFFGVLVFSSIDFQRCGDMVALLYVNAFGLGIAFIAIYQAVISKVSGKKVKLMFGAFVLVLVVFITKPWMFRPDTSVHNSKRTAGVTLTDQRYVANVLHEKVDEKEFVLLEYSELLFLMRYKNPLPIIYLNSASRLIYSEPGEKRNQTAVRLLKNVNPDVFIGPHRFKFPENWRPEKVKSIIEHGDYKVPVYFLQ